MKNVQTEITAPYYELKVSGWVYRGFVFLSDTGVTFMFLQEFSMFGHATSFPQIKREWKLYRVKDDKTLESLSMNGMSVDGQFLIGETREKERRTAGMTISDMQELIDHARNNALSEDQTNEIVRSAIQPGLAERARLVNQKMEALQTLSIDELGELAAELNSLCQQIKAFYPRSYENLSAYKNIVREQYAKLKYPELYNKIKKAREDNLHEELRDPMDNVVGFGPLLVLAPLYYKYFLAVDQSDHRSWEYSSPFEKKFGRSVLFSLEKA